MMTENGTFKIARMNRMERDDSLKAVVDIITSSNMMIKGLKVVDGKNGLFVGMPGRQGSNGKWYDSVYPLTKETKEELTQTILSAYQEAQ